MTARTWRTKSGIIMFHLSMPTGGKPAVAIRTAVHAFLGELGPIGTATEVTVSTRSGGEDAETWTGAIDPTRTAQRLEAYPDATNVTIAVDLKAEGAAGAVAIPGGMTCWVQLAEVDSPPDAPLELNITLDTDVYVARSWGEDHDNRDLALRNAPAFNRFLAEVVRRTGATAGSVSAEEYPGQVTKDGIVVPTC